MLDSGILICSGILNTISRLDIDNEKDKSSTAQSNLSGSAGVAEGGLVSTFPNELSPTDIDKAILPLPLVAMLIEMDPFLSSPKPFHEYSADSSMLIDISGN